MFNNPQIFKSHTLSVSSLVLSFQFSGTRTKKQKKNRHQQITFAEQKQNAFRKWKIQL